MNLEAPAGLKHCDYVVDVYPFDEPKTGRCDIYSALRIVERVGFVGALQ